MQGIRQSITLTSVKQTRSLTYFQIYHSASSLILQHHQHHQNINIAIRFNFPIIQAADWQIYVVQHAEMTLQAFPF